MTSPVRSWMLPLALVVALPACDRGLGRHAPPTWCTPVCEGRECGEDGCGGVCGECDADESCSIFSGECLGAGVDTVYGHLKLEARLGNVEDGEVFLDARPTILPAHGANVLVVDGDGAVIGARQLSSRDGGFDIPVSRELDGNERLVISTLWAPTGEVLMAVLMPEYRSEDAHWADYVTWLWTWDAPVTPGQAQEVTIRESQGSGALYIYLLAQTAMEAVLADLARGDTGQIARLGLVWLPGELVYCGTCYAHDSRIHRIEGTESDLNRSIFIDGQAGGSSAWGWPVVFHEMGHYVAFNHSRDNSPGGPHSIGQRLDPPFAWSEGWASFWGALTATRWFGEPTSMYWDVQYGSSFWIDLDQRLFFTGDPIGMPYDSLGILQDLDEFFVTAALWSLWDESGYREDGSGTLSTAEILQAFGSPRFLTSDRGWPGSDLVDFIDAAICLDASDKQRKSAIVDDVDEVAGFPYDGKAMCDLYTTRVGRPSAPFSIALEPVDASAEPVTLRVSVARTTGFAEPVAVSLELPDGARLADGPGTDATVAPGTGARQVAEDAVVRVAGLAGRPATVTATWRGNGMGARATARWPEPAPPASVARPALRPLDVPFRLGPVTVTRSIAVDPE